MRRRDLRVREPAPTVAALLADPAEALLGAARGSTPALPLFTSAAKPSAVAANVGRIVIVRDAGATTVQICVQNSVAGYEWLTLGTST